MPISAPFTPGSWSTSKIWGIALYAALLLPGCGSSISEPGPVNPDTVELVYPGIEWERIDDLQSVGWCQEGLDQARTRLSSMHTTGLIAAVGGRILFEYGDTRALSYVASVRKSVISILYGIYHDRGQIDLTRTLADLGIDDLQGLTDAEKRATTRDLLMARSGVYHPASNPGDDLASAPPRGSKEPGEYYLYSNWDFNALGTIFERETNVNIFKAVETELALPLQMQDFDLARHRRTGDRTKSQHLAYHMYFSTRDMARIGHLMLRDGRWNGRQIVSTDWVRESTSALTRRVEMNPASKRNGRYGYGYLWWVYDNPSLGPIFDGGYSANGAGGQYIVVIPSLDLVVAHKTDTANDRSVSLSAFNLVLGQIIGARCETAAEPEMDTIGQEPLMLVQ